MLNLFASTLWAVRVSDFMLREMFDMFECLTTFITTVLVGRHGIPPARSLQVAPRTKPRRRAAPQMRHCSAGDVHALIGHAWQYPARSFGAIRSGRSETHTLTSHICAYAIWMEFLYGTTPTVTVASFRSRMFREVCALLSVGARFERKVSPSRIGKPPAIFWHRCEILRQQPLHCRSRVRVQVHRAGRLMPFEVEMPYLHLRS